MLQTPLKPKILEGFDDPSAAGGSWNPLAAEKNIVFLTREWHETWWRTFGRGKLLLIAAGNEDAPSLIAPLFADCGMIFFTGSGGSDYLDFVGDLTNAETLAAVLDAARQNTPDFLGFRFYHVPDESPTGALLGKAAERLGLSCFDEGELTAPALDLRAGEKLAEQAASKKSLVRHERYFEREGKLEIRHVSDTASILPQLENFFSQHIRRWEGTPWPSLFNDPAQRLFYENLTRAAGSAGWLRFTSVEWNGEPAAFHFGFSYGGRFLWYKPSFEMELARRSPGEVLLRRLLLYAGTEGAEIFDFGLGDEAFKKRFMNKVQTVRTWGLYPKESGR